MLLSRWQITARREKGRLVLEVPAQAPLFRLGEQALFQIGWPIGALVLPVYLTGWIDNPFLWLLLTLLAVGAWMIPWFYGWTRIIYWLWGTETITIQSGAVEVERGFRRWVRRARYTGTKDASWRVSPWKHHALDWRGRIGFFGLYGPRKPGGALTFSDGRRAVRCGRNFGTRKARIVLRLVREFLGQPAEGEPPEKTPSWLVVIDEETPRKTPRRISR